MRRRHPARAGALAALALALATLGQATPAAAQEPTSFPDGHYCEVSGTPPFNTRSGVISVTGTVRCWTDSTRQTPGQVRSIAITIQLYKDSGIPVGTPKEVTRPGSTELTTSLTVPDPGSSDVQLCESGRHYAEVTGEVVFKSGMPERDADTFTTGGAFVTCQASFPPLPSPVPVPPPGPDPSPAPPPDPDPSPRPPPNCPRFPCTPPIVGDPPA